MSEQKKHSLRDLPNRMVQVPPPDSDEARKAADLEALKINVTGVMTNLQTNLFQSANALFHLTFGHPRLNPLEAFDALGDGAAAVVLTHQHYRDVLAELAPEVLASVKPMPPKGFKLDLVLDGDGKPTGHVNVEMVKS